MKILFNILSLLIFAINFASAQSMDITLKKLIDNNIIEQKQKNDFLELLKHYDTISNAAYLQTIFLTEYKKLTGHSYSQFGVFLNFGEEKPKQIEQDKINEDLSIYLSKLKICDLINEKQFAFFKTQINNNGFVHKLQFLSDIIEQVELKEYMNSVNLKSFANKLKSKEIVNLKYAKLCSDIEQDYLQNPIDFLNYCDKAIIINEQDYSDNPESYLKLIHQKTASILPELSFTDFEFDVILDSLMSDNDSKFYNFVVTLNSNGKKYKQKSSYHLYNPSQNKYYGNKIDQQEYYKIFNKILADLQSPFRLHEVKAYQGNTVEWKKFGIIALTKEQADLLHGGGVYFTPSYENFKNKLTSSKIEQAIEEYKKIGLLSHLTSEQIAKAKEKVSEQENINLNSVLLAFPNIIHIFDTELGNLEDPYAELVREYKRISHNDFNAVDISDNFNIEKNKKTVLKFKIGTKSYNKTLRIEDDWIDTDFFNFIKNVVTQNNLRGQFYELHTGGQDVGIIYLTKEQYDYLKTNKLLIFGDEQPIGEE